MLKIYTINDCSPEFVELQMASLKKHLQEDFEFTLFNSDETIGLQPEKSKEVSDVCQVLSIPVVKIQRDAAVEAAHAKDSCFGGSAGGSLFREDGRYVHQGLAGNYMLQWVWNNFVCKETGPVCFIHSDIFLIEPIKFTDYLKDHVLVSYFQRHTLSANRGELVYLWDPFVLADMSKLPNPNSILWWPSYVRGEWTDTGGQFHHYLKAHPNLATLEIGQTGCVCSGNVDDDDPLVDFHPARYRFFHLGDKKILHYYSGSRWCTDLPGYWNMSKDKSDEYHTKKLAWARKLIGLGKTS